LKIGAPIFKLGLESMASKPGSKEVEYIRGILPLLNCVYYKKKRRSIRAASPGPVLCGIINYLSARQLKNISARAGTEKAQIATLINPTHLIDPFNAQSCTKSYPYIPRL